MAKLSFKIALPIILSGLFIIVIFIAYTQVKFELSFYIILLLLVLYLFLFGFTVGQRIAFPVKKLLQRAQDLSRGDLASRVYLETKDEFEDLIRVFNQIAEEIQETHSKLKSVESAVDIKVKARTHSLEETIIALEQKIKNRTIELERLMQECERLRQQIKAKENQRPNNFRPKTKPR